MTDKSSPDRLTSRAHRLVHWLGYLLIAAVALRRRYDLAGNLDLVLILSLLGIFTLLYAVESFLSKRTRKFHRYYFAIQMLIALALGTFREYQDTWALLPIVLGFQVGVRCSRREAAVWFGLFAASLLAVLSFEFGLVSGLGRAAAYAVICILLISYDVQYARHEEALAESQVLLAELNEAHEKLAEYAGQAEALAVAQERERMVRELYDLVGQKIFAIQLAAETARLMLEREPSRAAAQIEDLQVQTQSALGNMRQLISQWRPG
jgi:signal transduction histidine kinase